MNPPDLAAQPLSPMKRALHALEDLSRKYDRLSAQRKEPIAIVGIGCRFPGGVSDAASCWAVLRDGVDAITPVPADRWNASEYYDPDPNAPGKMRSRFGGFLPDVQSFDAPFFRVSPREAISLDPQHRLLLEVCWEALEDAGVPADDLAGSRCGVFAGMSAHDYLCLLVKRGPAAIDQYLGSGNAAAMASGRISYFLGCQGTSLTVDTACSSSLVAVHLACQSLRNLECDQALAGGVNLVLCPEITINFSKARMLAADGRCKAFDASADGYVRSDGCGVVVLKRVSDARRDGDRILALIRGSAVNQDGQSSGITVPNGQAQREVIREALAFAEIDPSEIGFIEAHGTGTSLGDPIEMEALASVFSPGRDPGHPLIVGAAKSNFGHMEAAAGVAGLIKTVLALQKETIPPNLHFRQPNPNMARATEFPYLVPTGPVEWRRGPTRRLAGVSAFGFSGTNVHLVVEEGPEDTVVEGPKPEVRILTISAKSESSLHVMVDAYIDFLRRQSEADFADIAVSSNLTRSHFKYRIAIPVDSVKEAIEKLTALRLDKVAAGHAPEVTFAFAPPEEGVSPQDWLHRCLAQYRAWQSWGIAPSANLGEGLGRYAAACAEGTLSREDALRFVKLGAASQASDTPEGPILRTGESADSSLRVAIPASRQEIQATLADLYVRGCPVSWRRCHEGTVYRRVRLPGHPFTRQRFWFAPASIEERSARFYRAEWNLLANTPHGIDDVSVTAGLVRWLIVADRGGVAESVAARLRQFGCECELIPSRDFGAVSAARGPVGVLLLDCLDIGPESLREPGDSACSGLLQSIQALAAAAPALRPRLWIATRGAVPVLEGDGRVLSLAQAPVWGLARALRREEPALFGGIVDLDPHASLDDASLLVRHLLAGTVEDFVAFRSGRLHVPRLIESGDEPARQLAIRGDSTYLITGGLGNLGMRSARWLAERGARHIVLIGRRASLEASERVQAELRSAGAQALVIQGDVSLEADVKRVLESIRENLPPLRGIIHAAGLVDDGLLRRQDAAQMARVLAPKVQGAWHLHRLTEATPLDFFVLFSAGAGILGSPGQGSYAAANAFLDALAHHRCAVGLHAVSINWGPWSGGGMATVAGDAYRRRLEDHGIRFLSPETGLAALNRLLDCRSPQAAVFDIDWSLYAEHIGDGPSWPFLSSVLPVRADASSPRPSSFLEHLVNRSHMERREMLAEKIESELMAILQIQDAGRIDREKGFSDMGVDSLLALELKDRLQVHAGRQLSSTVVFEYPTVDALAKHLLELLFPAEGASSNVPTQAGPDISIQAIEAMSIEEVTERLSDRLASILGERRE